MRLNAAAPSEPAPAKGTALHAICYLVQRRGWVADETEFLEAWLAGKLDDWPDYLEWLKAEH